MKMKFYFRIIGVRERLSMNIVKYLTQYTPPTTLPFSATSPTLYHSTPHKILLYKLHNRPLKKAVVFVQFGQFQKVKNFLKKIKKSFRKLLTNAQECDIIFNVKRSTERDKNRSKKNLKKFLENA